MGVIAATSAIIAGTATAGQIALVGTALTAAGGVGQAVSANKLAKQQQKMANIQNAREKKMALRSMRMQQRALEAQGVSSGTSGSSGITGAIGATASSTASAIGYQGAMTAGADKISKYNSMAAGFGALSEVGSAMVSNSNALSEMFNKPTSIPPIKKPPKPTASTINTGSNFIGFT